MTKPPVVVGVDGSEESLRAVDWAALEARRHAAPLRIVSVPAMPPRMNADPESARTIATVLREESIRALGAAVIRAREISPGLLVGTDLLAGPPALAVTDSGAGALMLVVGARGGGGFAAMLLGSVSRYAAMHASCPVVVAREESGAVHREIVVGVRDPEDGGEPLGFAFEEAALRRAILVVAHSWYWFPPALAEARIGRGLDADPDRITAEAGTRLARTLGHWRDKYPDVPVRQDVMHGHPARILASYSARADLVVIGRHAVPGTTQAIGGLQHAMLSHAHAPVAVIPAAEE